jgi:hypothetical protein
MTGTSEAVKNGLRCLETMAHHLIETDAVPGISTAVVHRDEVVYATASVYAKRASATWSTSTRSSSWHPCRSRSRQPWLRRSSATAAAA